MRSLVISFLAALSLSATAADVRFESAGIRGGIGSGSADSAFYNYEGFAKLNLPWRWAWGSDWGLQTGLDFSAGVLQRHHEASFIGQAGPCFTIGSPTFPVSFEFGSSPTLLSQHDFDKKDLGSAFQFTSYGGLRGRVTERFGVGYRFQHTSNAGLGDPNPGLNMHVLSLFWRF